MMLDEKVNDFPLAFIFFSKKTQGRRNCSPVSSSPAFDFENLHHTIDVGVCKRCVIDIKSYKRHKKF